MAITQEVNIEMLEKLADGNYKRKYPLTRAKKVARFVIGTSTAGWTAADCDYLCDGTADQTEINAAITALPATGGEIVILDGTYNITKKIDVTKDNVSIRGNGSATILKRMFNSSVEEGLITLTGRSGCKIANLQIEGNKTSYTNNNNRGIYLSTSSNNTVTGNTCNNNVYGIYLVSSSNNNTVTGNTCNNNDRYGIYLVSSSNNTVTGNTCNNNNRGIYLVSSSNNTVTGNTCNNNNIYGIYLVSSSNNTVTGNTCNNNNYGVYLSTSSNNTVTGNTCNNNNIYGIYLRNSSSNNTITSNTCVRGTGLATDYTASQHTIQLAGTGNTYNLISNNNCMGKAVTNGGGTGNSVYGNKYDATDDFGNLMPISGGVLENYREKLVTLSGTSTAINLSLGNVFTHSLTGNTTYSIINAVKGQAHSFTLIVNMGSTVRTLTFPASVKWQGGEIPDMSEVNKTYVLTFVTVNGGTTWLGMFGGEF